ncbi:MAG: low molecular weight protein-tyrosine-phosphatase [Burkholderiales bacterium]
MAANVAKTRILFVCLGNICRSPTAEVVFRSAAARAGLAHRVEIDSAGTGEWHIGNPPDYRAIAHAARRGYDLTSLRARQVTVADFERFHWILAMDHSNLDDLRELRPPGCSGHLRLFLEAAGSPTHEVPDPYDGGPEGFERMLDLIESASTAFAGRLVLSLADNR